MFFLFPLAHALQVPGFSPEQRVVVTPQSAMAVPQVTRAAERADRRVYVVVFEEVIDGQIAAPWTSETEEALETVWATWLRDDRFDASEDVLIVMGLDDREVRIRTGSRWDSELYLHTASLGRLIDEHFMPLAGSSDLDGGLAALTEGIDDEIGARLRRKFLVALLPWLSIPAVLFGGIGLRMRRRWKEHAALLQAIAVQRAKLDGADEKLAVLTMDVELRNQLIELRRDGTETDAACRRLAELIEEIRAGLVGLRRRLDAVEQKGAGLDQLEAGLVVSTEEHRLFDDPARTLSIEPGAFFEALEARYQEARELWAELEEAVRISLLPVAEKITDARLRPIAAQLRSLGLSDAWLSPHPLHPDPAPALQALADRRQDPMHYLDLCVQFAAAEDEYIEDVTTLLRLLERHRSGRTEARGLLDTAEIGEADLAAARERADRLAERVEALTGEAVSVADFEAAVAASLEAEATFAALRAQLSDALETAPEALAVAGRQLAEVTAQLERADQQLAAIPDDLSESERRQLQTELSEAREDLGQMAAALVSARGLLAGRRPLSCLSALQTLKAERSEALEDLGQFAAAAELCLTARAEAQQLWSGIDAERAKRAEQLTALELSEESLWIGDELLAGLRAGWDARTDDWSARRKALLGVIRAWDSESRMLISDRKIALAASAEADESLTDAVRKMRREELLSTLTFGAVDFFKDLKEYKETPVSRRLLAPGDSSTPITPSHHSSHRSSSLGSGFGDFSSSASRSSSRSSSSSSRSGGRSFSSGGGRSGGRKF